MKTLIYILFIICLAACGRPIDVTSRPNAHTATSGTLGSAKFNNQLPAGTMDTLARNVPRTDTLP
ncbi:hypothetical protein [Aridibaculum aurantiacum]|uniref:hypothetical protein n=1 Tax=Aridibaculum aurantiacum TaxID=2810307 RepID=UPI001A95D9CB|nr:hypothetical protein [Aridibaculum aurantiacum]